MTWFGWWKKKESQEKKEEVPEYEADVTTFRSEYIESENKIINTYDPYIYNNQELPTYGNCLKVNLEEVSSFNIGIKVEIHLTKLCLDLNTYSVLQIGKNQYSGIYNVATGKQIMDIIQPVYICDELYIPNPPVEQKELFTIWGVMGSSSALLKWSENVQNGITYTNANSTQIKRTVLVNKFNSDLSAKTDNDLVISDEISYEVYKAYLPLPHVEEHGPNYLYPDNPTAYVSIIEFNNTWYDTNNTVECTLNLGDKTDIDLNRLKNVYAKNVIISSKYEKEIEKNNPFKYWDKGVLKSSFITYVNVPILEYITSVYYNYVDTGKLNTDWDLYINFNDLPSLNFLDNYLIKDNPNDEDVSVLYLDLTYVSYKSSIVLLGQHYYNDPSTCCKNVYLIFEKSVNEKKGNTFTISSNTKLRKVKLFVDASSVIQTRTYNIPNYGIPKETINNLYCIKFTFLSFEFPVLFRFVK